ncbi:ChuX/HutX family heme-like substrate-binding protein [Inquilinus sp. CAU 1745]|uniref:hemin-degrading factor n=1 Tax=Inquilinus sp. CAU 1745 TaxID=3140369 RepID=UPI00325AF0F3
MDTIVGERPAPADLAGRWAALKEAEPKLRIRDAAARLGVSEAELLATGAPEGRAVLLQADPAWLIEQVPTFGEVMALTRNDHAVHEKVGRYDNISIGAHAGLVLNQEIDLRLFMNRWKYAFAVMDPIKDGIRKSLQFFDKFGRAVHKIYLRPESDEAAFDRLVASCRADDQSGALSVAASTSPAADHADSEIDLPGLRTDWENLHDTHEFHGLLRRYKVGRHQALRLIGDDLAYPVDPSAFRFALESAAETELPIMVFVGNEGCIQIHGGPIVRTAAMGPWFNVLDPAFNLHVREDAIEAAWVVRKPTVDGVVTSVELYGPGGVAFLTLFGVRKPGKAEDGKWRELVDRLPAKAS